MSGWTESDLEITVRAQGHEMTIRAADLESFGLSIPSDVYTDENGVRELGRSHISLTGMFKEGIKPEWREIGE